MSMDGITEEDVREAEQEMKEHYREQTGHELPDHVVENLEHVSGTTLAGLAAMKNRSELAEERYKGGVATALDVLLLMELLAASGFVGLYVSRFFSGWPAQVAGGTLTALLAFASMAMPITVIFNRYVKNA